MFPFRSWAHNPSQVLARISELCGCITRIPVSHFVTQPTVHHVRWSSVKQRKYSAICCNESSQNCSAESRGNVSCSNRNCGECSLFISLINSRKVHVSCIIHSDICSEIQKRRYQAGNVCMNDRILLNRYLQNNVEWNCLAQGSNQWQTVANVVMRRWFLKADTDRDSAVRAWCLVIILVVAKNKICRT
jgi:hypothetical protein